MSAMDWTAFQQGAYIVCAYPIFWLMAFAIAAAVIMAVLRILIRGFRQRPPES